MSELVKRLHDAENLCNQWRFSGSARAIFDARKRITELEARLEIAGPYDGIAARDETIRLLEARLVEQTGSHNDLVIRKSDRITELSVQLAHAEAQLAASNARVELLEHDMKSGDYESLYARAVHELQSHSSNTVGGPTPVIDAAPACEPERSVSESIAAGHPCFDPDGPPDHDWEYVDDSFSHEFGTEICGHYECARCNAIKPE